MKNHQNTSQNRPRRTPSTFIQSQNNANEGHNQIQNHIQGQMVEFPQTITPRNIATRATTGSQQPNDTLPSSKSAKQRPNVEGQKAIPKSNRNTQKKPRNSQDAKYILEKSEEDKLFKAQSWSRLILHFAGKYKRDWKKICTKLKNHGHNITPHKVKKEFKRQTEKNPCLTRENFQIHEDFKLAIYMTKYNRDWKKIAEHMPGRKDTMVKNRYYAHLRKQGGQQLKLLKQIYEFGETIGLLWEQMSDQEFEYFINQSMPLAQQMVNSETQNTATNSDTESMKSADFDFSIFPAEQSQTETPQSHPSESFTIEPMSNQRSEGQSSGNINNSFSNDQNFYNQNQFYLPSQQYNYQLNYKQQQQFYLHPYFGQGQ